MDINGGGGGGGGVELLISEVTANNLAHPISTHKTFMLIFITSHLSYDYHGIYYTNTVANKFTGIY